MAICPLRHPGALFRRFRVPASNSTFHEVKKRDFIRREVHCGIYDYSTTLPEGVKGEDIKASYKDGVPELVAPLPKALAPKEVKVQVETSEPVKVEAKAA